MVRIQPAIVRLLLLSSLAFSCQDLGEGVNDNGGWAIYRLSNPALTGSDVRNVPLSNLSLAAVPILSTADIRSYAWKTHTMECTAKATALLDSLSLCCGSVFGVPFVVTVDRKPVYMGCFWWDYSSIMQWCPFINLTFPRGQTARTIHLLPSLEGNDPRSDMRIYHSLRASGLLIE